MLRFFKKLAYESEKENSKAKIIQLISFSKKIHKKRPLFNLIFK